MKKNGLWILSLMVLCVIFLGMGVKNMSYNSVLRGKNTKNTVTDSKESEKESLKESASFDTEEIKEGDMIFQTTVSAQGKAVQLVTKSPYTHCGIIFKEGNEFYVFEAIQPVKSTLLTKWIARGKDGKYVIKRLKNADEVLTPKAINKMRNIGKKFQGKDYDLSFKWSDDKMYCSELIWKLYKRGAGIEIATLEKLSDFDLSHKAIQELVKERYGNNIPWNETVISPAGIFNSELLFQVTAN